MLPPNHPCNFCVGNIFELVKPLDRIKRPGGPVKALVIGICVFLLPLQVLAARRRPATTPHPAFGPSAPATVTAGETALLNRILSMEEQRALDQTLLNAVWHSSSRIRKAAILAIGRIGDPAGIGELAALLNKRKYADKETVVFSLGLFPDEVATTVLVQHLAMQKDSRILAEIYLGLGRQGGEKYLQAVTKPIRDGGPPALLDAACLALGMMWSKPSEEWAVPEGIFAPLARAISSRQPYGTSCAFAVSRFRGPENFIPSKDLIKAAQENGFNLTKSYIARILGRAKDPESLDALVTWAAAPDTGLRMEAMKGLASHPFGEKEKEVLLKGIADRNASMVVATLTAISNHGASLNDFGPKLDALFMKSTSPWIRGSTLRALGEVDLVLAKKRMEEILKAGTTALLPAALSILAISPTPEDNARIANYLQHESPKLVVEMMDSLAARFEGEWPPEWRAAFKKSLERGDPAICTASAQIVSRFGWKELAPSLMAALSKLTQPDQIEPKVAVLTALAAVGSGSQAGLLQASLNDPQKAVVQAAADTLKVLTGQDFSQKIPSNSRFPASSFQKEDLEKSRHAEVVLKTNRGEITMQMLGDAPLTALNFTRLVNRKFYDGLTFHRVVPHFVAQGGDPRGDGYGGSGYLVRDEFSDAPQVRATVGVATSGRDTGGSQFYINLNPNRHLDGRYTIFARVTGGIEVADRLEEGDRILSARVR